MTTENPNIDEKLTALEKAWKGIVFDGADLCFNYSQFVLEDGRLTYCWCVGWKSMINGCERSNCVVLCEPSAHPDIVNILRTSYEEAKAMYS